MPGKQLNCRGKIKHKKQFDSSGPAKLDSAICCACKCPFVRSALRRSPVAPLRGPLLLLKKRDSPLARGLRKRKGGLVAITVGVFLAVSGSCC